MKNINNPLLILIASVFFLASCNKELETFAPITKPAYPTGTTLGATLASTPNDSLFNRLLIKSGLSSLFIDSTRTFTMFVPDNTGMKIFINALSGGAVPLNAPDAVFSGFITANIPAASAAGIVQYNVVGGKYLASALPTSFANLALPTQIVLDPTQPFIRMSTFPSKRATYAYVNTIPITTVDQLASNGVIHHTFTVVAPPSTSTLKVLMGAESTLSYFRAALNRGDSGQVGLNRFDSLLNYPVTNMTVLAPNDAAMQPVLFGVIYSTLLSQGVPQATAFTQATALSATPAGFNLLPVATVRGILAYHILATNNTGSWKPDVRAFSVNFSPTPAFVKTLVNGAAAAHPGINAQAFFTGPVADSVKFTGLGTFPPGGAPFSSPAAKTVTGKVDKHALNGVYHIIDKVLLPQ
jgi:hypothetical protein